MPYLSFFGVGVYSQGMIQTKTKEELLQEAIAEVEARRRAVMDIIDKAAIEAAHHTVSTMSFEGTCKEEIASRKLQSEAADRILDMAGFKIKRSEHSFDQEKPLGVVVLPQVLEEDL